MNPDEFVKYFAKQFVKGNILLAGFGVGYSWGGVILKP